MDSFDIKDKLKVEIIERHIDKPDGLAIYFGKYRDRAVIIEPSMFRTLAMILLYAEHCFTLKRVRFHPTFEEWQKKFLNQ